MSRFNIDPKLVRRHEYAMHAEILLRRLAGLIVSDIEGPLKEWNYRRIGEPRVTFCELPEFQSRARVLVEVDLEYRP